MLANGLNWHALPAFLAVMSCAIILVLTHHRGSNTYIARLYRAVVLMWVLNISCELVLFVYSNNNLSGTLQVGLMYYTLCVLAVTFLAHLSIALATDLVSTRHHRLYVTLLYAPALLIQIPLWFTDWVIPGYQSDLGVMPGVAWNSLHGPGYVFYLAIGFVMYMAITTAALLVGVRSPHKPRRLQCYVVLLSSTPLFLFAMVIIGQLLRILPLNQYINATFAAPFGIIIFCIGTGYAIYRHRLVDIEFYIPWSEERRTKRDFYRRIQTVSDRMPQLQDPEEAARSISEVLRCPVVIRSRDEPILTTSPISQMMAKMPMGMLARYDRIVIADDIVHANPELAKLMQQHKVFAAVPVPQGAGADSVVIWVLLGQELSESVYSSRDFAMVSLLFQRMELVFLNQIGPLRREVNELRQDMKSLQITFDNFAEQVGMLVGRQPVDILHAMKKDTLLLARAEESNVVSQLERTGHGILYVGKDRDMFYALRKAFPHIRKTPNPNSKAFGNGYVPAVIVYDRTSVNLEHEAPLVAALEASSHPVACYVLGRNAKQFVNAYATKFHDVTICELPTGASPDDVAQEVYKNCAESGDPSNAGIRLAQLVDEFEKRVIEIALDRAGGKHAVAARLLDISPSKLVRKITRHGIIRNKPSAEPKLLPHVAASNEMS